MPGDLGAYAEADLLPLSGLQHLVFCERQCALIHVERLWRENALTAEGRLMHERVDGGDREKRGGVRIARGVRLRSFRLGLVGRADVVEFLRPGAGEDGVQLKGDEGRWVPRPVEYKRGRPKWIACDRVQLCAQAICLEEMLDIGIHSGALYYGLVRRRERVRFDRGLRKTTEEAARRFHEIVTREETPMAFREAKCSSCSLLDLCLPPPKNRRQSVAAYLDEALEGTAP